MPNEILVGPYVIEEKCSFTTKEGPWNGVGKSKAMTHEEPLHIFFLHTVTHWNKQV